MASQAYKIPRSFKLRMELEVAEKGHQSEEARRDVHLQFISLGLGDLDDDAPYDQQLKNWTASIIGPQNTPLGENIYTLNIVCPPSYPESPPIVKFVNKINMKEVDQRSGQVSGIPWNANMSMFDFLRETRVRMIPASKLKQPGQHETF